MSKSSAMGTAPWARAKRKDARVHNLELVGAWRSRWEVGNLERAVE